MGKIGKKSKKYSFNSELDPRLDLDDDDLEELAAKKEYKGRKDGKPKKKPVTSIIRTDFGMPSRTAFKTLNQYYSELRECIPDFFQFLHDNPDLATDELKPNLETLLTNYYAIPQDVRDFGIDLDGLCRQSGIKSIGILRRCMNYILDVMAEEDFFNKIKHYKPNVVETSLQIAMADLHKDSFKEREMWMKYFGIAEKSNQQPGLSINVNQNNQSNSYNNSLTQMGLSSLAKTIKEQESSILEANVNKNQKLLDVPVTLDEHVPENAILLKQIDNSLAEIEAIGNIKAYEQALLDTMTTNAQAQTQLKEPTPDEVEELLELELEDSVPSTTTETHEIKQELDELLNSYE